jgi:hypothetical protein
MRFNFRTLDDDIDEEIALFVVSNILFFEKSLQLVTITPTFSSPTYGGAVWLTLSSFRFRKRCKNSMRL